MAKDKLEARRVYLRAPTPDDAASLYAAVEASRDSLKRRLRWVGEVSGAEDSRAFIHAAGDDETTELWGVFEQKDDRLVGVASLRGMEEKRASAEIGFWIVADRQDKGLGSEVGRLIVDYGFRKRGLHRMYARLDPSNRAFRRVLKKVGFRYEGCLRSDKRLNGRWVDQECWGLLKTEWKRS